MIMNKKLLQAIAVCLAMTACSLISPDAQSVLRSAQKAMGSVKSIQYSGVGMNAFFGQALTAGKEWPRRPLNSYTVSVLRKNLSRCDGWSRGKHSSGHGQG